MIPPKSSGPHPDAEALYRSHSSPKAAGSAAALAHAATCSRCSEELAGIEAFAANPADPFGGASRRAGAACERFGGRPARRPVRVPIPALAIAAAVVVLVGGAILMHRPTADVERGGTAQGLLVPAGVLSAPPEEFRFPVTDAASVRVSVFDADRTYVWTSPSAPASRPVPFPPEERARLRPGVAYTWVVLGEGSTLPARTFEIRAAGR